MPETDEYTQVALDHVCHLSEQIGGRGSSRPAERRAAEYAAAQMEAAGAQQVRLEPFQGVTSTYRPFALAFATALLGTLLVWLVGGRLSMAVAALLAALAAWGMLAETDLADNWLRRVLPRAASQNAVGVVSPTGTVRSRVVLAAHLDTHRTPIFYSSRSWYLLFGLLVGGAFVSLAVAALAYLLGALFGWDWVRWIGLAAALVQLFALALCLHADFTPFSPGANDNASGAGVTLAIARRLAAVPLAHTEVWLAFTGNEEVGAHGVTAFLDAHAADLGPETVYVAIDQVGVGRVRYLTSDGLIVKRRTHPRALELARHVGRLLPELHVRTLVGIAYTDALAATRRGLIAITVCSLPPAGEEDTVHWHRTTDTLAHVEPEALADAHAFTWQLLHEIDRG